MDFAVHCGIFLVHWKDFARLKIADSLIPDALTTELGRWLRYTHCLLLIATASTKKNTKVFLLGEKNVTLKMFTFISNIKENYPILLLALKKKKKKKKAMS